MSTTMVPPAGTANLATNWLQFELTPEHEASDPPEARDGTSGRDDVRLLVSAGEADPGHARVRDLPRFLEPGDLLVVNNSATLPASVAGVTDEGVAQAQRGAPSRVPRRVVVLGHGERQP